MEGGSDDKAWQSGDDLSRGVFALGDSASGSPSTMLRMVFPLCGGGSARNIPSLKSEKTFRRQAAIVAAPTSLRASIALIGWPKA